MAKIPLQDRLQKARAERHKTVEIAGSSIDLHKWTLDQSLQHSALIWDVLRVVSKDTRPKAIEELLKVGGLELFQQYGTKLKTILIDSVVEGNFDSAKEAEEWVNVLTIESCVDLLVEIWKLNLLPLARRLGVAIPVEGKKETNASLEAPKT